MNSYMPVTIKCKLKPCFVPYYNNNKVFSLPLLTKKSQELVPNIENSIRMIQELLSRMVVTETTL